MAAVNTAPRRGFGASEMPIGRVSLPAGTPRTLVTTASSFLFEATQDNFPLAHKRRHCLDWPRNVRAVLH